MYSFHLESQINRAQMGYIRMSQTSTGLITPKILGATLVNFQPRVSDLYIAQAIQFEEGLFSAEDFAASGIPECETLEELRQQACARWAETLKDISVIDRVTTLEAEERKIIETTTPSNLVVVPSLEHSPENQLSHFTATPDELVLMRSIGASIMDMKPAATPEGYL